MQNYDSRFSNYLFGGIFLVLITSGSNAVDTLRSNCARLRQHVSESDVTDAVFTGQRYNYWDRPVLDANKSVEVNVTLFLRAIAEVNERSQTIKLNGYLRINWFDEFHVWNKTSPLNCIEDIILPHGKATGIWLPDIAFTNSGLKKYEMTRSPVEMVRIRSNGLVNFAPGSLFDFQCDFNLALFPFDVQTCVMTFESWCYQTRYQRFAEPSVFIDEHHNSFNEEWKFHGGQASHKWGNYATGEFDWIEFEIHLKRKSGYYALTIILPCLLIAAVEVVTFAIPFDKSNRLNVSFTCLLAYSMFQSLMTGEMPHSADNPPLLLIMISLFTIYIAICIYLQSICLILSCKAQREEKVSHLLLTIADFMAPLVCLPTLTSKGTYHQNDALQPLLVTRKYYIDRPWTNGEAWYHIATVANRYSFLIFLLLLFSTSFTLLVIVPLSSTDHHEYN